MIKATLALGGALVLAGCVAGDRVTLLEPAQADKRANGEIGSVAVLDDEAAALSQEEYEARSAESTDLEVLDARNQQALLRQRGPRVRTLDEAPDGAELLADLPLQVAVGSFGFETGSGELSREVLDELKAFLGAYIDRFNARYSSEAERPELHIEILGFADSDGYADTDNEDEITARNKALSDRRAAAVYYQLLAEVGDELPIRPEDIVVDGAGDLAAYYEAGGQRVANDAYRIVTVTVR